MRGYDGMFRRSRSHAPEPRGLSHLLEKTRMTPALMLPGQRSTISARHVSRHHSPPLAESPLLPHQCTGDAGCGATRCHPCTGDASRQRCGTAVSLVDLLSSPPPAHSRIVLALSRRFTGASCVPSTIAELILGGNRAMKSVPLRIRLM